VARLWSKIKELDRRLPSSSIGTLVAIIFGLVGLSVALWYQRKPQLKYEILSQWPVYSIREQVPDLDITFKGESIQKQRQTLSVITIRVSNPGSAPINLNSFDRRDLPGFLVTDGKIIKLDPVERSKKLEKTLELVRTAENAYAINPLILETDQFFVLKLLVLGPESSHPKVQSFGDVAGVAKIEVVSAPSTDERRSFISRSFYEDWTIQLTRALGYSVGTIVLIVLLVVIIITMYDATRRVHRRRLVHKFRTLLDHEPTKKETAIFDRYIQSGESTVVQLNQAFADRESLKTKVLAHLASIDPNAPKKPAQADITVDMISEQVLPWDRRFIPMLLDEDIITVQDKNVAVDEQTAKTTSDFESFLLANEPERLKTAKAPLGSDTHPVADLTISHGTQKPENE
jgi:hypothetical protein